MPKLDVDATIAYRWENRARAVLTVLLLFLQPSLNGMANSNK